MSTTTALTKDELLASLQKEVRILLHLISKVEPEMLDYRPTPEQRSTLELIRHLSFMGPTLIASIKAGAFDGAAWEASQNEANAAGLDQLISSIESHSSNYAQLLEEFSDADFRGNIELFGQSASRGRFLADLVLCACAAYRMQLFLYLKSCGRKELGTMNLWAGIDAPVPVA